MRRFRAADPRFDAAFANFLAEPRGSPADVEIAVGEIIEAVRADGMGAVRRLTKRFDGLELSEREMRVSTAEMEAAAADCPVSVTEALTLAANRIRAYHERQRPADLGFVDEAGVRLGWRWRPLDSVGVYVPGGRAAYPSTVLMNVIPATVAGVGRIAMATPPGRLEPAVLAAARLAGVTELWRVGGAQAIAALALGAGALVAVDKVVGPGNAFVTAAKRRLYGQIGIDSLAGPSELVVVADAGTDPTWIAADLLSQAEHDPDAQAMLITDDDVFADKVEAALAREFGGPSGSAIAVASWRTHGAVIIAARPRMAAIIDRIAPEHVELAIQEPETLANEIRHAGAIFLGRWAPEAIGDYVAGSNHVLPTNRTARFSSGLSVMDFQKRTSLIECGERAFGALAKAAAVLAHVEGLPAHGRSLTIRMGTD